ncbi:MAG: 50S ribosomal protein L4 [Cocleimonas sp.]
MELKSVNGKVFSLSDDIFAREFNESLVHQAVVSYLAAGRTGSKAQKSRSDVSGGGAKPWRQKGTGRARAGTSRGPLWRKGGVTFAARPRNYSKKMNKKMYRAAMCSIFSELVRSDSLVIVEEFGLKEPKTKVLVSTLEGFGAVNSLLVTDIEDFNVTMSVRNIPNCESLEVSSLNPVSLISHDKILVTSSAVAKIQEWLK